MKANPFKGGGEQAGPASEFRQFEICADYNRRFRNIGYRRWFYVEPAIDGRPSEIRSVEGIEAEEVWTVLRGRNVEYASFTPAALDKIERRARWLISRGMSAESFATICARHRWPNPRSETA